MKKLNSLRKIISLVIIPALVIVCCMSTTVLASDSVVSGKVNYTDKTIEVNFDNLDIPYVTTVMFYLLGENDTFDGIDGAIRIGSAVSNPDESVQCSIEICDDIDDGYYKIYAVSGGYENIKEYSPTFRIMHSTNATVSLGKANNATQSTIASVVYDEFKDAFEFETKAQWKSEYLYNIRANDFNGSFKTIDDVNLAWINADILKTVNTSDIDSVDDAIDVDKNITLSDEQKAYFEKYIDETFTQYKKMGSVYSMQELNETFKKAIAIATVNNCKIEDLDGVFKAFKQELGISEYMERYLKVSSSDFARQFDGFVATDVLSIKTKFTSVLTSLEGSDSEGGSGNVIIGGGGFGGGGGGGNIGVSGGSAGTLVPPAPQKVFSDLLETHWAYNPIIALNKMGIINGYNDGTFKSEANITREEFAKVVVVAFGLTDNGGEYKAFADANGHWAEQYIKIAYVNGVVNGIGNNKFGVGQKISRQDAAVMIQRAAKAKGITLGGEGNLSFKDAKDIADYAKVSVGELSDAKIINGFTDGTFKPNNSITRAETAKIVYSVITK